MSFRTALLLLAAGILFSHCAKQVSPSGGAKDETPPRLDSLKSTPNEQVNFEKQDLFFGFDEWVVVKNPFQQVVISPPLAEFPEIKTKGKGVVVLFGEDEEFLENTTYTINFGETIQDLNEGNVLENFSFVFSTGPFIDSLFLEGRVYDARNKEPMEGVLVMLYDNLEDSIIYKERPVYFAKTEKNGTFRIQNIRQDTFILRALKDENLNYLYDLPTEWVSFIASPLLIQGNIENPSFRIEMFQKATPVAISEVFRKQYGHLKIALNQEVTDITIEPLDEVTGLLTYHEKDSVYAWYRSFADSTLQFALRTGIFADTITAGPFIEAEKDKKPGFGFRFANTRSGSGRTPADPLALHFSNPVRSVDTSFISVVEDTLGIPLSAWRIDSSDQRKVLLEVPWKEAVAYQLEAMPEAFTDIFGQQVRDTIEIRFKNSEIKNFGNIILTMDKLDPQKRYLVRLMDKEELLSSTTVTGDSTWTKTYPLLPPKTYSVELIEDLNGNGKWDTGDYDEKRLPEPILISELEPLRAGWDVTAELKPNGD